MLILTRRLGESVILNDNTKITILSIKGNQVRLGAIAPKEVPIHREEVYERIKFEKESKKEGE